MDKIRDLLDGIKLKYSSILLMLRSFLCHNTDLKAVCSHTDESCLTVDILRPYYLKCLNPMQTDRHIYSDEPQH